MLDIKVENNDGNAVVKLVGRLDTNTSSQLETEMKQLYLSSSITFDLEGLDYVSSSGLRLFLLSKKVVDDTKIINASDYVMSIFEDTGFTTIMDISKNEI